MTGRKLIEVALPLDAINKESAREKAIRHGHPSTLHLWWARRPLAACRAVIFASLVDDPSSRPDLYPTEEEQEKERERLFRLLEELVLWENTENQDVLRRAREEIAAAFDGDPPPVLDPFCGGGSIPLEAQRLGLDVRGSDLNPVAALITRALVEIPPRFAGQAPVNPDGDRDLQVWSGAQGLADDVRYYGRWMRDEAEGRIGHLFPDVELPSGKPATVIAWISARTVTCPNPACRSTMPLLNSFALSKRRNREAWLRPEPKPDEQRVTFEVVRGTGCPKGGSVSRSGAECLVCGESTDLAYVRQEGKEGRMGAQLLCVVAEGARRREYLRAEVAPAVPAVAPPTDVPDTNLPDQALGFRVQGYGITKHRDLFTDRQLVVLTTFCDLVEEARQRCITDGASEDYANAVATYLTLAIGRLANRGSSQSFWYPGRQTVEQVFARNALPMMWVFAEGNPFSDSSGNFNGQLDYLVEALTRVPAAVSGEAAQKDAAKLDTNQAFCVVTDPPYYDNVPYADLSDFFYVWLRRAGRHLHPDLFGTVLVPKVDELIAEPARQGSWDGAAVFFEEGLRKVFERIRSVQVPEVPFSLFYAFKQAEDPGDGNGRVSTGWDKMLQGLVDAGCSITATWPVRTEQTGGLREYGRNSLASSIVLACRPRPADADIVTRRDFLAALRTELPLRLTELQLGNVPPVDLAQASIGPGMSIFSRYARVVESDGTAMRVRTALGLINQVLDEVLREQEGEFDPSTRWAIAWFEEYGSGPGEYGRAETLATAKAVSITGLERDGIVSARGGRVQLMAREDRHADWDPATDDRLTVWEITQYLTRALATSGEQGAADLAVRVGSLGELAKDLAYRLYTICERKAWHDEAGVYNALVAAWSEISRLATGASGQARLDV